MHNPVGIHQSDMIRFNPATEEMLQAMIKDVPFRLSNSCWSSFGKLKVAALVHYLEAALEENFTRSEILEGNN